MRESENTKQRVDITDANENAQTRVRKAKSKARTRGDGGVVPGLVRQQAQHRDTEEQAHHVQHNLAENERKGTERLRTTQ